MNGFERRLSQLEAWAAVGQPETHLADEQLDAKIEAAMARLSQAEVEQAEDSARAEYEESKSSGTDHRACTREEFDRFNPKKEEHTTCR